MFVSSTVLGYIGYVILVVMAGLAAMVVDSIFVIGGVLAITGLIVVMRFPFLGFLIYTVIYFLRPGERFEALAPLRIEFSFGILLLLTIIIGDALRGSRFRFPRDDISISLLAFIAVLWIDVIFSVWGQQSLDAMISFIKTFVLYYFVLVMIDTKKRFSIVYWLVVLLTAAVGLEASIDYFTGDFSFSQGIMRAYGATSFGEHPNSLALYMATTVPMVIYLMSRYRGAFAKFAGVAIIGVCFLALILTGSRSGLLCLTGTGLVFAWFSHRRLIYFAVMVIVGIGTWFALPDQYKARYATITSDEVDESSQGRLDAWMAGVGMFIDHPFTGVGPKAFAAAYLERDGVWLYSHSLYIELLASLGLLGVVTWSVFLYCLIRRLRTMAPSRGSPSPADDDNVIFARSNYAILAGLLIAGVFGHILFRDTWYVMAAIVAAKYRVDTFKAGEA